MSFVKGNPLIAFFLLACVFSWGQWVPAILSQRGIVPFPVPVTPLGSFGPAVGAIAVLLVLVGRGSLRAVLQSALQWRARPRWYAFAVLFPLAMNLSAALPTAVFASVRPELKYLDRWYLVLPLALLILVLGGPLGEEIGWRGFALPRLQERFDSLTASAIIGGLWLVWHLPLFWMEGAQQKGSSLALFALTVFAMAVLFTWLYNRTGRNLWMAIVFHTSINVCGVSLPLVAPDLDKEPLQEALAVGLACVTALTVALREGRDLGRNPEPASKEHA